MSQEVRLIGYFSDDIGCADGIEKMKEVKAKWYAYSPIPSEKIAEATGLGRSPVRITSLIFGIGGVLVILAITIGTSLEWNIVTGGKPIVSLPAFLVVTFEFLCLSASIGAAFGFFLFNQMPVLDPFPGYSTRFSGDRFGLVVQCEESESGHYESLLRDAGAEGVTRENA